MPDPARGNERCGFSHDPKIAGRQYLLDFYEFVSRLMLGPNGIMDTQKRPLSACHKDLCRWITAKRKEDVGPQGQRYRMALWPRGSLKSSILAVAYPIFCLLKNPDERILISSVTHRLSCDTLRSIRGVFENEVFQAHYGDLSGDNARTWGATEITIASRKNHTLRDPSVRVTSVESSSVGGHYDRVICDDLHDENNSGTREQIEKVLRHINLMSPIMEPKADLTLIGTRWTYDDAYGTLENDPDWEVSVKQAEYVEDGKMVRLFPEKYTDEFLELQKRRLGDYGYSCQFLNNPIPDTQKTFKKDWIDACYFHESWPTDLKFYITIDPAIGTDKRADSTAIVVNGIDTKDVWHLVEIINKQGMGETDLIETVFGLVKKYRPIKVGIETTIFQRVLKNAIQTEMIRRHEYFQLEELRPGDRAKEVRIRGLQPRVQWGRIKFRPTEDALVSQMQKFPRTLHDDVLDALAYQNDLAPICLGATGFFDASNNWMKAESPTGPIFAAERPPDEDWYDQGVLAEHLDSM